jgi:hypothetical protein
LQLCVALAALTEQLVGILAVQRSCACSFFASCEIAGLKLLPVERIEVVSETVSTSPFVITSTSLTPAKLKLTVKKSERARSERTTMQLGDAFVVVHADAASGRYSVVRRRGGFRHLSVVHGML